MMMEMLNFAGGPFANGKRPKLEVWLAADGALVLDLRLRRRHVPVRITGRMMADVAVFRWVVDDARKKLEMAVRSAE